MYEGCILLAFSCDLKPSEEESKYMNLKPEQMYGLHKMGWSGLHYKCRDKVMPLVEGPLPRAQGDDLLEIVEMLGVKLPPAQILQKNAGMLSSLYPRAHIQTVQRDLAALAEECSDQGGDPQAVKPFERIDWQGCTALHHAVVHASAAMGAMAPNLHTGVPVPVPPVDQFVQTLLYHGADIMKQNRRGFSPLEVASLTSPFALPMLVNHYLSTNSANAPSGLLAASGGDGGGGRGGKKVGGGALAPGEGAQVKHADKIKALRKLQKTLESSAQHVKHALVKRHSEESRRLLEAILTNQGGGPGGS